MEPKHRVATTRGGNPVRGTQILPQVTRVREAGDPGALVADGETVVRVVLGALLRVGETRGITGEITCKNALANLGG